MDKIDFNELLVKNIQQLLKNTRITQAELADNISTTRATVNAWLSKRTKMDAVKIKLISDFFNMPMEYFFQTEEERNNKSEQLKADTIQQAKGNNNSQNINNSESKRIQSLVLENKMLKAQLKDKEEIIRLLKK